MSIMEKKKPQVKSSILGHVMLTTFEASDPQVLWHFDLEKTHSFTLTLERREGGWDLGATPFCGEFQPIAHFENYDAAETALEAVKKAMNKKLNRGKLSYRNPLVAALLGMLALFFALNFVAITTTNSEINQPATMSAPEPLNDNKPLEQRHGVPVPADELLK